MIRKRGAIWGRLVALRLLGVPVPKFSGFNLFRNWLRIPIKDKLKSVFGTARRAIQRGHRKPRRNTAVAEATPAGKAVLEKVDL
jgi:coenzyme F420 hydrogenase subunit beta